MLILFDVDGTLVDSAGHIHAAMVATFAGQGLDPPDRAETMSIIGLSLPEAFTQLAPAHDVPVMVEAYKDAFAALRETAGNAENAPLYPGIRDALERMKGEGRVLGIATGKSRRGLSAVMETHGLNGLFETVQVADDHPSKPNPSMIEAAMAETMQTAGMMIGDTTYDMEMARNAGVRAVGVAWGYHPASRLTAAGAETVLRSIEDLEPLL